MPNESFGTQASFFSLNTGFNRKALGFRSCYFFSMNFKSLLRGSKCSELAFFFSGFGSASPFL